MENFKFCEACSMPLTNPQDEALSLDGQHFCVHCVDEHGAVKSCAEIFDGGVQFFLMNFPDLGKAMAEKITRKNMLSLPYWQDKKADCLNGEVATDAEFEMILKKLKN